METTSAITQDIVIPGAITEINQAALATVNRALPELQDKTKSYLGRSNSQSTLTMMTLTLLGGQSAYRMLRQILSETNHKKAALVQAQLQHSKLIEQINRLKNEEDEVSRSRYNKAVVDVINIETQLNNVIKDIAVLCDAYEAIKEKNGIIDWDEEAFEKSEKRHHVRRCFEMMYRNLVTRAGTPGEATIEYCQQYGVHPQVCEKEVRKYFDEVNVMVEDGETPDANHLEDFLDSMADKYQKNPDKTCERLFGKSSIANYDYMYKNVTK